MDNKKTDRRDFLSKLGVAVVAGAALSPIVSNASEDVENTKEKLSK